MEKISQGQSRSNCPLSKSSTVTDHDSISELLHHYTREYKLTTD